MSAAAPITAAPIAAAPIVAAPPAPPAPPAGSPAAPAAGATAVLASSSAAGLPDDGGDTRTVAIQLINVPDSRPASGPMAADTMGSTMTMAPISAPPAQGPGRPGSGPQPVYPPHPVYPPQPGSAPPPPPPDAPRKGPTTGMLAALKGLGGKGSTPPAGPPPGGRPRTGPLSIDDANGSGPMPIAHLPVGQGPGAPARQGGKRPPGTGLMVAIGVAGLALGVIVGVIITAGQQADANQAITDAQNMQTQFDEQTAEIEADRAQLDEQRNDVAEREQALGEREAQVEERETALEERETALEQAEQQQQEEEQQQDEEEDNNNGGGNDNPGTVFYWNCDAVRAAGAAPLASDQPGYLPHLDANGNGIACEDGE